MELAVFIKTALITDTALLPFTMALVNYWGKLGISGKWQLVSSMLTGLVLGGFFMFIQVNPQTLVDWSLVGFVGLVEGLAASGVYELGLDTVKKVVKPEPEGLG